MQNKAKSIRPFIGSDNFELSSNFYRDLGFTENVLDKGFSVFTWGNLAFYLQDASVREWIDNTMIFMEMEDVRQFWTDLQKLGLTSKYPTAKILPIREEVWGRECFVQDPSGILWHFGEFD